MVFPPVRRKYYCIANLPRICANLYPHIYMIVYMPQPKAEFERLFREHYASVAAFAYRLIGDRDAAEDVATDVFAVLWERDDVLKDAHRARFFLYRTARNIVATRMRDEQTRNRILDDAARNIPNSVNQEDEIDALALNDIVRAAIVRMPEQRRAVYTLRWEQDLSYAEVAELLGISVKAVEKHVSLALADLREALKGHIKG